MLREKVNFWPYAVATVVVIGLILLLSMIQSPQEQPSLETPPKSTPVATLPQQTAQRSNALTEYSFSTKTRKPATPSKPVARPAPSSPSTTAPTGAEPQFKPLVQKPVDRSVKQIPDYQPKQVRAAVHPTNYGERLAQDLAGRPINYPLIVVLHETVGSALSAVNFFQTPHYRDEEQASYHAIIALDGTIIYLVPPEKRAFGAGDSIFYGPNGPETAQTNPNIPASVNSFAYHISLETPFDGQHNEPLHSGYTEAQYRSLAWLVARTHVPDSRITTHAAIDQSGERQDPRSFDFSKFSKLLHQYPRPAEAVVSARG